MKRSKLSLVRASTPARASTLSAATTSASTLSAATTSASTASISSAPSCQSLLALAARREVGRFDIATVVDVLREAMLREALERAGGNITHAADLLGITRQAVQQLIRRFELVEWHQSLRAQEGNQVSLAAVLPLAR